MQNSKLVEDYHLNNPDKSLLTQIGWMDIKAYKNGGAAVFANDDYGKSINADFIIGSPYHEQLKVHDDGDGRKSMHQNPMFWSRYIKINRGNNDKNKGTYYIYEQSHGFVYNGRYTGLKIDPENRWTHNTDNEKIGDAPTRVEKMKQNKNLNDLDFDKEMSTIYGGMDLDFENMIDDILSPEITK